MNLKQWEAGGTIEWEALGALSCLQPEAWGGIGLLVLPGAVRASHEPNSAGSCGGLSNRVEAGTQWCHPHSRLWRSPDGPTTTVELKVQTP